MADPGAPAALRLPVDPARVRAFIVGPGRTGTSLLRSILVAGGDLAIAPETHFLRRLSVTGAGRELRRFAPLTDDANARRLVAWLYGGRRRWQAAYWTWLRRNVEPAEFERLVLATDRTEPALFGLLLALHADRTGAADRLLGEKTPAHLYSVPILLEWFPEARVIHLLRDPRSILASKLEKVRQRRDREGPARLLPDALGPLARRLVTPVETAHVIREWRDAVALDRRYAAQYDERYRLVRFEDLVTTPGSVVRALCEFLGIPFRDAMIEDVRVVGSSFGGAHRGATGFDETSVRRWEGRLGRLPAAIVARAAGADLARLGYDGAARRPAPRATR